MGVFSVFELDIQQMVMDFYCGFFGGFRDFYVGIFIQERVDWCDNCGGIVGEDFWEFVRVNVIKEFVNIDFVFYWFKIEVGGNFQNGFVSYVMQDGVS